MRALKHLAPEWAGAIGRAAAIAMFAALFCVLARPVPALAQSGGSTYRIGPGDILRVDVTGHAELSQTITVDDQGGMTLSSVGWIRAAGRTAVDLAADIARRISLTQRETPQVQITVVEARSQRIYVLGEVVVPGPYFFRQEPSVWDAISEAGGSTDAADLSQVEVIPGAATGKPKYTVDVASAIRSGDYTGMPHLKPGDTVRVPRATGLGSEGGGEIVFVMGAVGLQGPHALVPPGDLVSTLTQCGPAIDADLRKVKIVRRLGGRTTQMRVDMDEYLTRARLDGNPGLKPGDTIVVPRLKKRFSPLTIVGALSSVIGIATSIVVLSRR
ncbi:MAG: polysaccharide biosynthesis/export family protein [Hyphomicrobiales bacterium]